MFPLLGQEFQENVRKREGSAGLSPQTVKETLSVTLLQTLPMLEWFLPSLPFLSCPVPSLPKAKKPRSSKRTKPHSHHQPVNTKIICHRRRSNSRPSHLSPIAPPVSLTSRNHPSPPSHADHCKDLCRFTGLSNGTQTTTPPRSASRAMEKFH